MVFLVAFLSFSKIIFIIDNNVWSYTVPTLIFLQLNLEYLKARFLAPLLFLIYINDLERNIKSNIRSFADDTMLLSMVNDSVITADYLNRDPDSIHQWGHPWMMEFIPDPLSRQLTSYFLVRNPVQTIHY